VDIDGDRLRRRSGRGGKLRERPNRFIAPKESLDWDSEPEPPAFELPSSEISE
jgi:hypothetical protein